MTVRIKPPSNISYALTLLTVAFSPLIEGGTTYLPVFVTQILILSMLAAHMYRGIKTGAVEVYGSPFDPAVAAFVIAALLSVFIAPYKYVALIWLQVVLFYALFFYLARPVVAGARGMGWFVAAVLGMGALQTAAGLVQWFLGKGRPTGGFFNPDMLADYLVPSILLSLSFILFKHPWAGGRARKAGLVLLAGAGLLVLSLTGSRGGALALSAGLLVLLWARWRVWALAAVAFLMVLLLAFPNPVREKVFSKDIYAYSRAGIWESAARMTADHPQGVGLGNFQYYWGRYNFPVENAVIRYVKTADTAHNEYLNIAAEMGIAGLAAFMYGVFLLARTARRSIRTSKTGGDRAVALGLTGGLTSVLVHGLVEANLHQPGIMFLLITLAVMLLALEGQDSRYAKSIEVGPQARRKLAILAGLLVILLFVWAAMPVAGFYFSEKARKESKGGTLLNEMLMVDRALLFEPGNASYHSARASILYRMYRKGRDEGRISEAMQELDEAERLNPGEWEYPGKKAQLKSELAVEIKNPEARWAIHESELGDLRRAWELQPYSAPILHEQARIDLSHGRREAAAALLERLKIIEPNYLKGRLTLAGLYMDTGRYGLSRSECYSIITIHKRLENTPLTEQEKTFTGVNMDEVDGLLKKMEGR